MSPLLSVLSRIANVAACWRGNRRGTVAVTFSMVLIPIIGCFSLAMSYAKVNDQRLAYQSIADAAALAGATASASDGDAARKTRAQNWLDTQITLQNLPKPTSSINVVNGTVVVNLSATITPMMSMLYSDGWTVNVASTAQIATAVIRRALDVVFCIDATGSMQNTINAVKSKASSFADDLNNALTARGYEKFDYTRIRVVFYRDFYYDDNAWHFDWLYGWYQAPVPIATSSFYEMPGQKGSLTNFLGTQPANGGGDEPESGYECINEGMSSSWKKVGDPIPNTSYKIEKVYPVIVLWTDANARPMPDTAAQRMSLYPKTMPTSQTAFTTKWNTASVIDQENRMLAFFGPCNDASWSLARSLSGYMCAGTLSDGNTNMVNKIADAMQVRYKNLTARLTR